MCELPNSLTFNSDIHTSCNDWNRHIKLALRAVRPEPSSDTRSYWRDSQDTWGSHHARIRQRVVKLTYMWRSFSSRRDCFRGEASWPPHIVDLLRFCVQYNFPSTSATERRLRGWMASFFVWFNCVQWCVVLQILRLHTVFYFEKVPVSDLLLDSICSVQFDESAAVKNRLTRILRRCTLRRRPGPGSALAAVSWRGTWHGRDPWNLGLRSLMNPSGALTTHHVG